MPCLSDPTCLLETNQKDLGNSTSMFKNNNQWHALSFVLTELCLRPLGTDADRAWRAVDYVLPLWESQGACAQQEIWLIVSQLKERAIQARRRQLVISRIPTSMLARQYSRSFPVVAPQHLNNTNDARQPLSMCPETPFSFSEPLSRMRYSYPACHPPDLPGIGLIESPGTVSGMNISPLVIC
jgi:hypothetical protein